METELEVAFKQAVKQHFSVISGRASEEERSYNLMIFGEMTVSSLLAIKTDNVFLEPSIQGDSDSHHQTTCLEYFKALFKKIEAKILSSPRIYENLFVDKLIEAERVIEV